MSTTAETVCFSGPGLRFELGESQGRCWLRIVVDRSCHPQSQEVWFRFSFQPRDSRGLPAGAARVVFEDAWSLDPEDHSPQPSVEGWLPEGLTFGFLSQCHVRV